ncbi:unnamed protein product [Ascophyllum nodosum]
MLVYYLPKPLFVYVFMVLISISRTILVTVCITVVRLGYDWRLCMVINISVQCNGGLLPDMILLNQGYYQWGARLNIMYWICTYSLCNVSYYYHVWWCTTLSLICF